MQPTIRTAPTAATRPPKGRSLAVVAVLVLGACKGGAIIPPGQGASKPAQLPSGSDPLVGGGANPPATVNPADVVKDNRILDVVMKINAKALGISACSGDLGLRIKLRVDPNDKSFKMFEIPEDTVKCLLVGSIGLKQIIEGGKDKPTPPTVDQPYKTESDVIGFKLLMNGIYDPPRPFLPAFFSSEPADLKKINVSKPVTVHNWVKNNEAASGTVSARTLNYQKTYHHEPMNRDFYEVYDFEFRNDGFQGADRLGLFLFDRMMLRVSLKPFALLHMELQTSVSTVLAGAGSILGKGSAAPATPPSTPPSGDLGTVLIGDLGKLLGQLVKVNIDGDLTEMASLPKPGEETVDDGIVTNRDDQKSGN